MVAFSRHVKMQLLWDPLEMNYLCDILDDAGHGWMCRRRCQLTRDRCNKPGRQLIVALMDGLRVS